MAVYIKMIKKYDDKKRVIYLFGPNEEKMGEIEFNKEKKTFTILKPVNDSKKSNLSYEKWATEHIIKLMVVNKGEFPDITSIEK